MEEEGGSTCNWWHAKLQRPSRGNKSSSTYERPSTMTSLEFHTHHHTVGVQQEWGKLVSIVLFTDVWELKKKKRAKNTHLIHQRRQIPTYVTYVINLNMVEWPKKKKKSVTNMEKLDTDRPHNSFVVFYKYNTQQYLFGRTSSRSEKTIS